MRFAAVVRPEPPERAPAAELLLRLLAGEPLIRAARDTARPQDLPADLDQRVRLVGEW
jgi:hypothetical protein